MDMVEIKKALKEFELTGQRMEKTAKAVYKQLKSTGVPCDRPFFYRGLAEWIKVGKNGLLSISEKEDKRLKYFCIHTSKKYVKQIEGVMKGLGIEEYIYSPVTSDKST